MRGGGVRVREYSGCLYNKYSTNDKTVCLFSTYCYIFKLGGKVPIKL